MSRLLSVLALVLLLLGAGRSPLSPVAVAQEGTPTDAAGQATPTKDDTGSETVWSFVPVGLLTTVELPETADLEFGRIELAPGGGGFPASASHPQGALIILESGTLSIRTEATSWQLSRGATVSSAIFDSEEAADLSELTESVPMGKETILQAGDVALLPLTVDAEFLNPGEKPAIALVIFLEPSPMEAVVGGLLPVATPTR